MKFEYSESFLSSFCRSGFPSDEIGQAKGKATKGAQSGKIAKLQRRRIA
jgi:hypothetical protein